MPRGLHLCSCNKALKKCFKRSKNAFYYLNGLQDKFIGSCFSIQFSAVNFKRASTEIIDTVKKKRYLSD